jgi:natural product precursor
MKKNLKKLNLSVETVRNLADKDLKQVAGGYDSYFACPQTEYPRPSVCQTNCHASDCYCQP